MISGFMGMGASAEAPFFVLVGVADRVVGEDFVEQLSGGEVSVGGSACCNFLQPGRGIGVYCHGESHFW